VGNCHPWGCGTPTNELKMSCWCKIAHKRLIHLHTLYYTMTTSDEAIKRVYTLIKKCKELKENGHDEIMVRKLLKKYHNQWYVTSRVTQNDDIQKVLDREFP